MEHDTATITASLAPRPRLDLPVGTYLLDEDKQAPEHDRRIPDDVRIEVLTRDDVRVRVDALLMFRIVAPERFVFAISAADFDQVCLATCRETVRLLVREKDSSEIHDLGDKDAERLRVAIGDRLASYGVGPGSAVHLALRNSPSFVATWLAVALPEEGAVLRAAGIDAPTLLLSEPAPDAFDDVVSNIPHCCQTEPDVGPDWSEVRGRLVDVGW